MKEQLKPLIDSDLHGMLAFSPPDLYSWKIKLLRFAGRLSWKFTRMHKELQVKKLGLSSKTKSFKLEYYTNTRLSGLRPCLVYYHGGGFVMPAFGYLKTVLARYALEAECDVLFVNYSLAPEAKSQEMLQQCEIALKWVRDNAQELQVDKSRIAIGGDSAGGALAASVAQIAYDKFGADALCGQMLIYPVTDDRIETPSMQELYDAPIWNGKASEQMWQAYLADNKDYAVPMERESLKGLAQAYVETAEFDPLRDEGKAYAKRLKQAGVKVVENNTKKTVHGFDANPNISIAQKHIDKRIKALKKFFA